MDDVLVRTQPRSPFPTANVLLFLATLATTLWMGFQLSPLPAPDLTLGNVVRGGFPFAASLVAVLFTHEMGHYVLARRYGVRATLPYFIPVPFGAGTLGAVIRMRSPLAHSTGPSAKRPSRILGPCRSASTATLRPETSAAWRTSW